jgi:hypothetical protein
MDIKDMLSLIPKEECYEWKSGVRREITAQKGKYKLKITPIEYKFGLDISPIPWKIWRKLPARDDLRILMGVHEEDMIGSELEQYYEHSDLFITSDSRRNRNHIYCNDLKLEYVLDELGIIPDIVKLKREKLANLVNKAVIRALLKEDVIIEENNGKRLINGYLSFDSQELFKIKKVNPKILENIFQKEKSRADWTALGYSNISDSFSISSDLEKETFSYGAHIQIVHPELKKLVILRNRLPHQFNYVQDLFEDFAVGWENAQYNVEKLTSRK